MTVRIGGGQTECVMVVMIARRHVNPRRDRARYQESTQQIC